MDNATWHKTFEVKDFCKKNNITLLFLPLYSPEFNPINEINSTSSKQLAHLCCSLI